MAAEHLSDKAFMGIQFEDGFWTVPHDHESLWMPKEEWICKILSKETEGTEWVVIRGEYNMKTKLFDKPLRWGFRDEKYAILFALRWK